MAFLSSVLASVFGSLLLPLAASTASVSSAASSADLATFEIIWRSAAGVLLLLGNAYFVAVEFGLTRLRQLDETQLDDPKLSLALKLTERLEIYLTSCQVGITTTSILLGVVAEPAVTEMLRPVTDFFGVPEQAAPATSIVLAVVVINLFHTVWGEQAPTYLGVERPAQVSRWGAPILRGWTVLIYPLIWMGDGLSKWTLRLFGIEMKRSWVEEGIEGDETATATGAMSVAEIRREMGEVLSRGELSRERRQEVLNALSIEEIPIRDVMIPRDKMAVLRRQDDFETALETLKAGRFSRYPLVGEDMEDFHGVIYVPALVGRVDELRSGEVTLADLATDALTLDASTPVSEAIDRFQEAGEELALVRDDESVVGLLTVTDALEEIAGELRDPFDRHEDEGEDQGV